MPLAPSRLLSAKRIVKTFPRAAYFNGVNAYATVPYSPSYKVLGSGTWVAWAMLPSLKPSGSGDVFRDGAYPWRRGEIEFDYTNTRFIAGFEYSWIYSPSGSLNRFVNRWLLLVYRRFTEQGYHELKVNVDEAVYSGTFTANTLAPDSTTGLIIAWNYPLMYMFALLIYSRALSDSEIQQIYADPSNPPRNGLVLWLSWDSLDCTNGKWWDKSGFGNHATLYNVQCVDIIKKPVRVLLPVR
jgi:hypothetical protein